MKGVVEDVCHLIISTTGWQNCRAIRKGKTSLSSITHSSELKFRNLKNLRCRQSVATNMANEAQPGKQLYPTHHDMWYSALRNTCILSWPSEQRRQILIDHNELSLLKLLIFSLATAISDLDSASQQFSHHLQNSSPQFSNEPQQFELYHGNSYLCYQYRRTLLFIFLWRDQWCSVMYIRMFMSNTS